MLYQVPTPMTEKEWWSRGLYFVQGCRKRLVAKDFASKGPITTVKGLWRRHFERQPLVRVKGECSEWLSASWPFYRRNLNHINLFDTKFPCFTSQTTRQYSFFWELTPTWKYSKEVNFVKYNCTKLTNVKQNAKGTIVLNFMPVDPPALYMS